MRGRRPPVSVIIPCYNGRRFLSQAIDSVLVQTIVPAEIIVVDDGSTDDSAEVAESYGPPVRVIRQANQGESAARNVGIAAARGDYLLFLDADDLLESQSLEILADAVNQAPGSVALMGFAWFTNDPSRPTKVRMPEDSQFFPGIITGNFGPPHCWLTPADLVRKVGGFHPPLRWFEDWEMWCRIALTDAKLVPVGHLGALYRQHSNSQLANTTQDNRSRGHVFVMECLARRMLRRQDLLNQYATIMFWSGWTAYHRARETGVSWHEVRGLACLLEEIVRRGPPEVRRLTFGSFIQALGLRWANSLRDFIACDC